jgi:hypothetical protein
LKRAFPGVKFSVKIETRGSSSINIGWTDGPTVAMVEKYTRKYQEGNFNGMEDIYEHNHENQWPGIFGGARYVFENRHESPELILKAAIDYGYNPGTGESDNYGVLPGLDHDKSQMIYRHAREMDAYVPPAMNDGGKLDREVRRQIRMNRAAETNFRNGNRNGQPMYY